MRYSFPAAAVILFAASLCVYAGVPARAVRVRVGYFPDVVHAAAIAGRENGAFKDKLGGGAEIDWKVFNAGPSVIEALFAGEIDIAYVGPNPAVNGFIKSKGKALRIICGAASGGAGLVVRKDSGISGPKDLKGKRIATPQLGNTQDVACRTWLKAQGLDTAEKGGTVSVIPVSNPDQLTLFIKKEIDGAWTKEPWVSRLIVEGGGTLLYDERALWPGGEFVTATVIVRTDFLREHPDIVKSWIASHVELTLWINANPAAARELVNAGIKRVTGRKLGENVISGAFSRTTITCDPVKSSLFKSADDAYALGFLGKDKPDLKDIFDLTLLNEVLKEKGLKLIQ